MNKSTSKLPPFPRPAPEVAAVLTESRANRLLFAMLTAAALTGAVSAPAKAAERDPRIVECEAKWEHFVIEGKNKGNEKQVKFATKKKLACAEDMAELIRVEKQAEDSKKQTERNKKNFKILSLDSRKVISYLKGESSISKNEVQRILPEYEHAIDELMKYPGFNRAEDKETFRFHKKLIEQAKKKIGQ